MSDTSFLSTYISPWLVYTCIFIIVYIYMILTHETTLPLKQGNFASSSTISSLTTLKRKKKRQLILNKLNLHICTKLFSKSILITIDQDIKSCVHACKIGNYLLLFVHAYEYTFCLIYMNMLKCYCFRRRAIVVVVI